MTKLINNINSKWNLITVLIVIVIVLIGLFIRLYKVDQVPPSPYWEEVALGYDAYSILKTGKDHHGNPFPIVAFESFGDYKPTLYFYSIIPFLKLFDLSTLAVRLPSVLSGTSIILAVGLITRIIFAKISEISSMNKSKYLVDFATFLSMAVTVISPWAIQFSRAGWEVNLATALVSWGVYFGVSSWQSETKYKVQSLLLSSIFLILSIYTYHATRVIAPLLGIAIVLPWLRKILQTRRDIISILLIGCFSLFLLAPFIRSLGYTTTSQRFAETSIFSDISIIEESNQQIFEDGNTRIARLIHHRYFFFGKEILDRFLSHFSLSFLFLSGDSNVRHSIQFSGQLYYTELIWLFFGCYAIWQWKLYKVKEFHFLLYWLVVGVLPASITFGTPHALRILPTLPVWMIGITFGIIYIYYTIQNEVFQKIFLIFVVCTYIIQFGMFSNYYSQIYPKVSTEHWQYGYQELISTINAHKSEQQIWITRDQGRPAMFYWFYSKTDPRLVQPTEHYAQKDQGEFLEFENIRFVNSIESNMKGVIATSSEPTSTDSIIKIIYDLNGEPIWYVYTQQ